MIYLCRPCKAWVGVHAGTDIAFGRLSNEELREWKSKAHYWFDRIAKQGWIRDLYPVYMHGVSNREKAYIWLAEQMGIKKAYCHIGMFDLAECRQVVEICQPVVEAYNIEKDEREE